MDEKMQKQAFRVVYDYVSSHQHPLDTHEYFMKVCDEIQELRKQYPDNQLLDCLMIGVYEYLVQTAKREAGRL